MWAVFVRGKEMNRGQYNYTPWKFVDMVELEEFVSEREEGVKLEHGDGCFKAVNLED